MNSQELIAKLEQLERMKNKLAMIETGDIELKVIVRPGAHNYTFPYHEYMLTPSYALTARHAVQDRIAAEIKALKSEIASTPVNI